jgi:hypothetical protein
MVLLVSASMIALAHCSLSDALTVPMLYCSAAEPKQHIVLTDLNECQLIVDLSQGHLSVESIMQQEEESAGLDHLGRALPSLHDIFEACGVSSLGVMWPLAVSVIVIVAICV